MIKRKGLAHDSLVVLRFQYTRSNMHMVRNDKFVIASIRANALQGNAGMQVGVDVTCGFSHSAIAMKLSTVAGYSLNRNGESVYNYYL